MSCTVVELSEEVGFLVSGMCVVVYTHMLMKQLLPSLCNATSSAVCSCLSNNIVRLMKESAVRAFNWLAVEEK